LISFVQHDRALCNQTAAAKAAGAQAQTVESESIFDPELFFFVRRLCSAAPCLPGAIAQSFVMVVVVVWVGGWVMGY